MKIKTVIYNLIIFYFLLEIVSAVLIEGFSYTNKPLFRQNTIDTIQNQHPHVADIDTTFGVWHLPNTSFRHVEECFDVMNFYNSVGARDIERTDSAANERIMLIGDSFAEGYAVDTAFRLSNLLEKDLNKEVMNFGTSGYFGSTQMRLLYQKLGKQFSHDVVLVSLFPRNDFEDDSFEKGQVIHPQRYRPYLVKEKGNFQVIYEQPSLENSSWHPSNIQNLDKDTRVKLFIKSFSYFFQILSHIKNVTLTKEEIYASKYEFFTKDEIEILEYNLLKIKATAEKNGASMIVFTIPSIEDLIYFKEESDRKNLLSPYLTTLSKENNFTYLDLLSPFLEKENTENLFLECDGHWSEEGNKAAKDILLPIVERELE